MIYAPDADILIALEKAGELPAIAALGKRSVLVTEFVWDEVSRTKLGATHETLVALAGQAFELALQTPEAASMVDLSTHHSKSARGPKSALGAGEASIIACAIHHPEIVPIFIDKLALLRGMEELRGRLVLSLHGFLEVMLSWGLPRASANNVSRTYCQQHSPATPPLWWNEQA